MDHHPSKRRRLAPKMPDMPAPPAASAPTPAHTPASVPVPVPAPVPAQHAAAYTSEHLLQLQHGQQYHAPDPPERHDFEAFARHLQDAAMFIYRQTQRSPYSSVSVLMLRWEEDTSVEKDLVDLEVIFREKYNYHTDKWTIPTVANPSIKLGVQMASFLDNARADHLLIIYYAGHGYVGPDGHLYWACHKGDDASKLKWDGVRCLLEDAQSDMLLLLDTCAPREAPLAGSHGVKQAIASHTPDRMPRELPTRSFTSYLAESLIKLSTGPFNVQRLYDEVAALRRRDASQQMRPPPAHDNPPVIFTLTAGKGTSINMPVFTSPKGTSAEGDGEAKTKRDDQVITPEDVADLTFDEARALVCTTFVGDASQDMSFFNRWIRSAPAMASRISVEGMFLGPPTMLLISMPHSIWNVVQHDKVCCFLGQITSHNMTHLYQRLVGSAATVAAAAAKEAENGRILLEAAREAAVGNVPAARHEHTPNGQPFNVEAVPTRHREAREDGRHNLPSAARSAPAVPPPPSSAAAQQPPAPSPTIVTKDEVEDSAEMQEAAEQLKALSHLGQKGGDKASSPGAQNNHTDGKDDDSGSSHTQDANESGAEENSYSAEISTPPSKPKQQRRSLQKHTPKQETRCNMCTHAPFKDSSSLRKHIAAAHTRPFPCAFSFAGCTSTFGSKNEWKRHIASQHLCLQYYRCSSCPLSAVEGKGNEFNRKDLFTQHLRRMHAPFAIKKAINKSDGKLQAEWDSHVKEMQQSCLVTRRKPPQRSACPKPDCQSVFEGPGSWDEWTEHVGRHMEKGEGQRIGVDRLLAKWALEEGIIERKDNGEYRLLNQGESDGKKDSSNINASSFQIETTTPPKANEHDKPEDPKSPDEDDGPSVDDGSIVVATTAPADRMDVDD